MSQLKREISLADSVGFIVDNRGKSAPTVGSGIKLIATNCVNNSNLYPTYENIRFVSQETYDNWFRSHPEPGDVLLTNKGSQNGAVCLVPDPVDFCIAQDMMALRANSVKMNPLYLFAVLRSSVVQRRIKQLNVDAVIPHFKKSDFDKLFLPYLDSDLQKWVGDFYYTFSAKIELNRRMNRTLEEMAQAIFKSWFVDFDPVKAKVAAKAAGLSADAVERAAMAAIAGKPVSALDSLPAETLQTLAHQASLFPDAFEPSELGDIPKGWNPKPLYDTAKYINGAAFKTRDFSSSREGLPIIKIAELKGGVTSQTKFTKGSFPEKVKISNDEVLYSWSGSPETSLEVFKWFGGEGWLNQHIFRVCTESKSQKYFVFHLLRYLKPRLISIATDKQTTGLGHVTVADMKRLLVSYPDDDLLDSFGQIVGPLYESSSNNEKQSIVLSQLRDTLLPKLLSGELPIPTDAPTE